jgi:hypothetical protein
MIRWQRCSGCSSTARCKFVRQGEAGCWRETPLRLTQWAHVVARARNILARDGAEDATQWLTAQYHELCTQSAQQRRHGLGLGTELPHATQAALLHAAEKGAKGVVTCLQRCPHRNGDCATCRSGECKGERKCA